MPAKRSRLGINVPRSIRESDDCSIWSSSDNFSCVMSSAFLRAAIAAPIDRASCSTLLKPDPFLV